MTDSPAPDFDWVTARNACSAANVFERLKAMAMANVDTRNLQRPDTASFKELDGTFTVSNSRGGSHNAADFSLSGHLITIQRHEEHRHAHTFEVTVALSEDGACKCRVDGEELDPWNVLKKVLEPLLFD
jgi:hypothetical protein